MGVRRVVSCLTNKAIFPLASTSICLKVSRSLITVRVSPNDSRNLCDQNSSNSFPWVTRREEREEGKGEGEGRLQRELYHQEMGERMNE